MQKNSFSRNSKTPIDKPSPKVSFTVQAEINSYPRNSNDIRMRINGRGLRTLKEGRVLSEGFRALFREK